MIEDKSPVGFERNLRIIKVLAENENIGISDMAIKTGIPVVTIHRIFSRLKEDLYMDISFVRKNEVGVRGNTGYYKIKHWGILDKDQFHRLYAMK